MSYELRIKSYELRKFALIKRSSRMGDKNYNLCESISFNYHLSLGSLHKKTV